MNTQRTFLVLAAASFLLAAVATGAYIIQEIKCLPTIIIAVLSSCVGALCLDVCRLKPGNNHSIATAIMHYFFLNTLRVLGAYSMWTFNRDANNFNKQQRLVLQRMLQQNKYTKFGKDHKLETVKSVEDFQRCIPLTSYSYYRNYIQEIEDEEAPDVLFPGRADYYAMTSGTTSGKSKMFPISFASVRKHFLVFLLLQKLLDNAPVSIFLKKILNPRVCPKFTKTSSGIRIGPISGILSNRNFPGFLEVIPQEALDIESERGAMYIHCLFGILEPEINHIVFTTSTHALAFFKLMENEWEQLCRDIEDKRLSEELDIPSTLRLSCNKHLQSANAERLKDLHQEFQKGFQDIVSRLWPSCQFVATPATGPFKVPGEIIQAKYLGNIPLLSSAHMGTETGYGFNFYNPDRMLDYTLVGQWNFFEFIKEEDIEKEQPETLLAHQVEPGRNYELVITTWGGLCRYRSEDMVRITGFYRTVPQYEYLQRTSDILCVYLEKVPEYLLHEALFAVSRNWTSRIYSYTTAASFQVERMKGDVSGKLHYAVFVEMESEVRLIAEDWQEVDEELQKRHEVYAAFRQKGSISPIQVYQVREAHSTALRQISWTLTNMPAASSTKCQKL